MRYLGYVAGATHSTLPPYPKRSRVYTRAASNVRLMRCWTSSGSTRERLEEADRISPFGLDELTKQIREENETYLRGKG